MARSTLRLGQIQLQLMKVLWDKGPLSAREITETLSTKKPIAHSTVQTLLRQLEAKGAVAHDVDERTFIYRPLIQQAEIARNATQELIARLFDGSVYGLVSHLLKQEQLSDEDLKRLRELVNREATRQEKQP